MNVNYTTGPWIERDAEIEGVDGSKIGQVYARPEDNGTWGPGVADANSRLMVAAPDLLSALERTLSHAIGHACDARGIDSQDCEDWPWVQTARLAIAKAIGGE